MKKIFALVAFVAALTAVFCSCKPDDEIYNPQCQISKIWYLSNVGDPDEVYHYDDKGVLTSIVIDSVETYEFTYNKDKTVANIHHVGKLFTEDIALTYTDRLVDKMVYTANDTVRQEITFRRDEETTRITNIDEMYDKTFYDFYNILSKNKKTQFYNRFIGDASNVVEMMRESGAKDLTLRCAKTIVYAPGEKEKYENIDSVFEVYPVLRKEVIRTYKYDTETYNPFYGLQYAYAGYAGYYLNNKLEETETTMIAGSWSKHITYKYSYEGVHFMNAKKYPRQFITISSENNVPRNTYILYAK